MTARLAGKILCFPLAAVALAALWHVAHPGDLDIAQTPTIAPTDGFARVAWKDAQPHVTSGEWVLADARDEEQFEALHIPDAVSLPANSYPEMLAFFAEDHGTNKTVVVYCGTESCDLSVELALRLRDELGFSDIRILDGGFLAWRRAQP